MPMGEGGADKVLSEADYQAGRSQVLNVGPSSTSSLSSGGGEP